VKEVQRSAKELKEIQALVRNSLFQAHDNLPNSFENYPVFVHLLTQDPLGVDLLQSTLSSRLRSHLSNKPSYKPFGDHLLGRPAQKSR